MSGCHRANSTVKYFAIRIALCRMHAGDLVPVHEQHNKEVTLLFARQTDPRRVEVLPQVATCVADFDTWIVLPEKLDELWYLSSTELLVVIPIRQRRGIRDVMDSRPSLHLRSGIGDRTEPTLS